MPTIKTEKINHLQKTEPAERCLICGRDVALSAMDWPEQSDQPVCRECLMEGESCGCSDD